MRPRKNDRHLPKCMYFKHGRYWLVKRGKWHDLGTDMADAMIEYVRRTSKTTGGMDLLIDRVFDHIKPRLAQSTIKQYAQAATRLKDILAEFSPEQVKPRDVAAIKTHFADTPNMANRIISFLRVVFDHALEWQLVDANPCTGIKRHAEAKRTRYLTDAELSAIYNAAGDALKPIIAICYYTGQRISDVLAIHLSDIDDTGIRFTQKKTGAKVLVKMHAGLADAINQAKVLPRPVRGMTLFCTLRGGRPYSYGTVKDMYNRAVEASGVQDATLHDLRAKALTDAKRQGLNPQALGGHTTEAMTLRYIRARDEVVADPPAARKF